MEIYYNQTMEKSNLQKDLFLCQSYGYKGIEIRIEYLQDYLKLHDAETLKALLCQSGLKPLALNSVDNINFCTAEEWDAILERFLFACRMCKKLDNPYIVVVPTEDEGLLEKSQEEIFTDSVNVLTTLSRIAEPYGAKIAFEPIGNRRWCVRSIRQAARIIRAVDRDNVGLTIDAMNLFCFRQWKDMEDLRQIPRGKVFVLHINDSLDLPTDSLEPEQHRLYPGDGVIPLKELLTLLKEIGYEGPASLELFNPALAEKDPESVIREGYEKTKILIDSL